MKKQPKNIGKGVKNARAWAVCNKNSIQKIYFYKNEAERFNVAMNDKDWHIVKVQIIPN